MNDSQLRGDLPEPVRRYFLEVAAMEPPSDLLDAAVAEIETTPRVNRFSFMPMLGVAAALVAAAVLAYSLLPNGGPNVGEDGSPAPSASRSVNPSASASPIPISELPPLDGLPSAGSVVATYDIGDAGWPVLYTPGTVWLANNETGTLTQMDESTGELDAPIEVNPNPRTTRYDLNAVSDGTYVWATGLDETMVKIDPATNEIVERVPIGTVAYRLAMHDDQLWITDLDSTGSVLRLDTATGEVVLDEPFPYWPAALAVTDREVWMAPYQGSYMLRLDPATASQRDRFDVSSFSMEILPLGDSLYLTGNQDRPLERFSVTEGRVVARMSGEVGVATDGDRLFGFAPGGAFMELDPSTLEPISALDVGAELGPRVAGDISYDSRATLFYVSAGSQVIVIDPGV